MQRAAHVVERRERIEAYECLCLTDICVNHANVVDRLTNPAECSEILVGGGILRFAEGVERRLCFHDAAPLLLEAFEELRVLLKHIETSREEERKFVAREIHD